MVDANNPIDWQYVLKITNNKPELAKEMISMLGAELPDVKRSINQTYREKKFNQLLDHIHKLHGSCCYCGVPHLREITIKLESSLKQKQYQGLDDWIKELNLEIDNILRFINTKAVI